MNYFVTTLWFGLTFLVSLATADNGMITCSSTQPCPESAPCCSQFGICGTGAYCLGGCDIRYSFNLTSCMPMPRMDSFQYSFDTKEKVADVEQQFEYLGNSSEADWVYSGWIDYHDEALLVQMPTNTTGTVLSSTKYLWYGKVGATLKTSRDQGVVSAFILFSDVQDEIDYEFVGYDTRTPQSNYYSQGILNYNNARNSTVNDTFEYYHVYEFDWSETQIDWSIDGQVVRTLKRSDTWNDTTKKFDFPQTPSRIQISLWPGGDPANGLGTIQWAGGLISWDTPDIKNYGYYYAYIKEFHVEAASLPAGVKLDGSSNNADDYHAYLYNSTRGNQENVYLTNKKTWLGNKDAVGFNPQNDVEPKKSSASATTKSKTVVKTSGSKTFTTTEVTTSSDSGSNNNNVPAQNTAAAAQQTATTTVNGYDPSAGVGGFVQDASETDNKASTGKNAASGLNVGVMGLVFSVVLGAGSLLF
ncbi:Extracellular glycosidase UTR2 [Spathaspora sp. JA1]|nr:Extracellular glycosidase UTR2 [Spathaspora sp. JA1]